MKQKVRPTFLRIPESDYRVINILAAIDSRSAQSLMRKIIHDYVIIFEEVLNETNKN